MKLNFSKEEYQKFILSFQWIQVDYLSYDGNTYPILINLNSKRLCSFDKDLKKKILNGDIDDIAVTQNEKYHKVKLVVKNKNHFELNVEDI